MVNFHQIQVYRCHWSTRNPQTISSTTLLAEVARYNNCDRSIITNFFCSKTARRAVYTQNNGAVIMV